MKWQNPFESVTEMLSYMMSYVGKKAYGFKETKDPERLRKELDSIKENVAEFKKITEQLIASANEDGAPKTVVRKDDPAVSDSEKRILSQLEQMKKELTVRKNLLKESIDKAKEGVDARGVDHTGKGDSEDERAKRARIRKRKKKFRGLGGKKGWKKL